MSRLSPNSADRITYDEKRELASRVRRDGYYTNGWDLVEIVTVGATGCVHYCDIDGKWDYCMDILDFRYNFWLVSLRAPTDSNS
jgi:hypothetical protein